MKKQDALSVGQIIQMAIDRTGRADEYARQRACYVWQDVVGPAINRYTTRRWVDGDALHVCLSSAPLKNELSYSLPALIARINEQVGTQAISRIVIH